MKVGQIWTALGMDFAQFDKDERQAKSRTSILGGTLSTILRNAFSVTLGKGFFNLIQQGFRASAGAALEFNTTLEQTTVGFTTMMNSAQKANAFVQELSEFALITPFELGGLAEIAKRMMAMEFAAGDVVPILRSVGDAAAALGTGSQGIETIIQNLGRMKTQGKVTSTTMLYLTRAGVPAWRMLAEAMGKSTSEVQDLVRKGLIPADEGIKAITEGMDKRFGGMMDKLQGTWTGVTAVLRGVWKMTMGALTQELFHKVTGWLGRIKDVGTEFYNALRQGGLQYALSTVFGVQFSNNVMFLISLVRGFGNAISRTFQIIIRHWTQISAVATTTLFVILSYKSAIGILTLATKVSKTWAIVLGIIQGQTIQTSLTTGILARAIQTYNYQLHLASMAGIAHVGVLNMIKTAIYSLLTSIPVLGWILIAIGAALGVGTVAWNKYNQAVNLSAQKGMADKLKEHQNRLQDSLKNTTVSLSQETDEMENLNKATNKNLQSFDEFHELTKETGMALDGMLDALDAQNLDEGMDLDGFDLDFDFGTSLANAKQELGGFKGWLKNWWQETSFMKWWNQNVSPWFTKEKWASLGSSIKDGISSKWHEFVSWWESTTLSKWWTEHVAPWFTKEKWTTAWESMNLAAQEKWNRFISWWNNTTLSIWWSKYVSPWFTKARWSGLFSSIQSAASEKWQAFVTWWNNTTLVKWFNDNVALWFDKERWKKEMDGIPKAFEEKWKEIENWWDGTLIGKVWNWGSNIVGNIISGIRGRKRELEQEMQSLSSIISDYAAFSSPTKKGPGRNADKWAPNFVRMYAQGILDNTGLVQSAASVLAGGMDVLEKQHPLMQLGSVSSTVSDSVLEALMRKEILTASNGNSENEMRITLELQNGEALVDLLIDPINRTAKTKGYSPVFKPVGQEGV